MEEAIKHESIMNNDMEDCYTQLLEKHKRALVEIDEKNQRIYDLQRKLREIEALHVHEVELIQTELDCNSTHNLNIQISQLKESLSEIRAKSLESTKNFELVLCNKDDEIEKLKKEIQHLKVTKDSIPINNLNESTVEELCFLKDENESLQNLIEELKTELEKNQEKICFMEGNLNMLKDELVETRLSLQSKRSQLTEALTLVDKLNDDLRCANYEIDDLKRKPLDETTKGNSLFAEVNDRRVYLQKKIDDMKADYIFLKKERVRHLNQISYLRSEMASLMQKHEAAIKEIESDKLEIDKAVQARIKILEGIIEDNKPKKNMPEPQDAYEEFTLIQKCLDQKNKQIEELQQKLSNQALDRFLLSSALAQANKEKRKLQMDDDVKRNEEFLKKLNEEINSEDENKRKTNKESYFYSNNTTTTRASELSTSRIPFTSNATVPFTDTKMCTKKEQMDIGASELSRSRITSNKTVSFTNTKMCTKKEKVDIEFHTGKFLEKMETPTEITEMVNEELPAPDMESNNEVVDLKCSKTAINYPSWNSLKKSSPNKENINDNTNANKQIPNEPQIKKVSFTGITERNSTDGNKIKPRRVPGKIIISKPVVLHKQSEQ